MVPELDPEADVDSIQKNSDLAVLYGAKLALSITEDIPCMGDVFDVINPMIVDKIYNCWFRDLILISNLPQYKNNSDEELLEIVKRNTTNMGYIRKNKVYGKEYFNTDRDCTWPEVGKSIHKNVLIGSKQKNIAAYILIFNYINILEIYWDVPGISKIDDADIYKYIQNLKIDISCLTPPVDRLEVYIVDARGILRVFASVQGSYLKGQDKKLSKEQIFLRRLP